ncbi:7dfe3faa-068d-45e9-bdf7-4c126311f335 [Thermothielavioides terrestris]|uniref:7dfe3faa-068d-45e9-bdf7-4c126311f335 n=1 Tax=Thermothielavioides terrestris TaxID=2587410 RepID=A0A3S4D0K2_9PEZI|nr:7dfe3faa-068d-45e9-bdf7-4c126311f335 [Thermothielavioides terrestris]
MFSNLATKAALKKVGLPTDTFDFSSWTSSDSSKPSWKKITKSQPTTAADSDSNSNTSKAWPEWMSVKSLPLTVQPWLTPRPPPIPVAEPPRVGDLAPLDRDRQLVLGNGRKVLVVFLRCVGCAFAQKTFLHLRALATRHSSAGLTCIAVSHSSAAATARWLDLLPAAGGGRGGRGAGSVQIVIDEDRAVYAAWGLGLGSVWYVLNPASQVAGFREKGWLGARVAGSLGKGAAGVVGRQAGTGGGGGGGGGGADADGNGNGPLTTMGNKWQQAGAWAVDGRGKVVWGGKAARVDDVLDLDAGARALGFV